MSDRLPARSKVWLFVLAIAVLVLLAGAGLFAGAVFIAPGRVVTGALTDVERTILVDLRAPRIVLAVLIGAGLSVAGAAYQSLFQNPLADPFIIGASSGAALGAAASTLLGFGAIGVFGWAPMALFAFLGALTTVVVAYLLGGVGPSASPVTLLLAGTALSTILGAVVSLTMLLSDQSLRVVFAWLLGNLSGRSWPEVSAAAILMVPPMLALWITHRPLDALTFGSDAATSFGLPVRRTRLFVIAAATLITAVAVAFAGIIGFVGLIAPHVARSLAGGAHRVVLPAAALTGAAVLVLADSLSRTVAAPVEVPVGVMTALMGGPFFLLLLRSRGLRLGGR